MNQALSGLTPADVTALCAAAEKAWFRIGPNARRAPYTWRGRRYVASHTSFRLIVQTAAGEPVACRYD
jgi:hypothetical protein